MTEITERLDSVDHRIARLVEVAEGQQQSVDRLSLSTERLALAFMNQARDITELRAAVSQLVELSRTSQQNIEASNYLAQRNLEAIRDLITELRERLSITLYSAD